MSKRERKPRARKDKPRKWVTTQIIVHGVGMATFRQAQNIDGSVQTVLTLDGLGYEAVLPGPLLRARQDCLNKWFAKYRPQPWQREAT